MVDNADGYSIPPPDVAGRSHKYPVVTDAQRRET
jgi:hypothetical protein